jgi:8-oxo-dGTP diphosphatase
LEPRKVDERDLLVCPACGWIFYNNSAPCVGVIVVRAVCKGQEASSCPTMAEVLLVKRAVEPFKGYWDIPGGFLESGEHPADGARREVLEETGLLIEPTEVTGFYMDAYGPEHEPTLNICYLAKVVGGEEKAGSDAEGMEWFPMDELPERIAFSWERGALDAVRRRG